MVAWPACSLEFCLRCIQVYPLIEREWSGEWLRFSLSVPPRAGPNPQNPIPIPTPILVSEPESPILIPGIGLFQGGGSGPIP